MELRPGRGRNALVEHLAEKRMPERTWQLRLIGPFVRTPGSEPPLLEQEILARLFDPRGVALERSRDRTEAEIDSADGRRFENQALIGAEPGDVVVDDGRHILGNRHRREPRRVSYIVIALPTPRGDIAHDRRHEQR